MHVLAGHRAKPQGIIIGHSNMDLDCLGSIVLARYLHPGFLGIRSARIHPLARNLFNLYQDHLGLLTMTEIDLADLSSIVVVDTRCSHQVQEYFDLLPEFSGNITVYDHHETAEPSSPDSNYPSNLWKGAQQFSEVLGANVSLLVRLLAKSGISIGAEDATIALAGLYADTGNFTHSNVTHHDFSAAAWLLGQGANLHLVKKFVSPWFDQELNTTMHELLASLQTITVNGQLVLVGAMSLGHQPSGLAMVVERIFELEQADAIFCVFSLPKEKSHLVIARSRGSGVDVAALLSQFGGGGHPESASALLRKSNDIPVVENLKTLLKYQVRPSLTAAELMSCPAHSLHEDWSLLEAALFLEQHNHAGAPVVEANGKLTGMLSLKEIQKGRKAQAMSAPVRAYMNRIPVRVAPEAPLRDIETIFFNTDLGRIPVVVADQVVGIISRSDLLAVLKGLGQRSLS